MIPDRLAFKNMNVSRIRFGIYNIFLESGANEGCFGSYLNHDGDQNREK
jgi:hypothetical protein